MRMMDCMQATSSTSQVPFRADAQADACCAMHRAPAAMASQWVRRNRDALSGMQDAGEARFYFSA
jgi:hypothetical protein